MTSNIDLIKKFYAAFKNQDTETYLALCDDNIEWMLMKNFPNSGNYVGKKAVFDNYFPKLLSNFKEFHAIPEEFLDAGDRVIVLGRYHMISKGLKRFESPFAHVYAVKDNKILQFRQFTDTAEIRVAM